MAKALAFSPHLQNFKNKILGTPIFLQGETSIFYDGPKKLCDKRSINRNVDNVLLVGGLSGVSITPLPLVPHSPHSLRPSRPRLGFPCLSLLPLRRSRPSHLQFFLIMSSQSPADVSTDAPQEYVKTEKCVIKGKVQGVFFRKWTVENATELGLKGWVRNRNDGSVEALFSGKPDAVAEMLIRCRRGPPDATVTLLQATSCNEDPGTGFQLKPTI